MSAACYLLEYSSAANDAGDVYYTRSDTSPSDTSEVANVNAPYLPNECVHVGCLQPPALASDDTGTHFASDNENGCGVF